MSDMKLVNDTVVGRGLCIVVNGVYCPVAAFTGAAMAEMYGVDAAAAQALIDSVSLTDEIMAEADAGNYARYDAVMALCNSLPAA